MTTLTARGDADALFTAAAIVATETGLEPHRMPAIDARQLALLEQAAALAPEAPEIARMGLAVCSGIRGCDIRPWVRRMDVAAPDDASRLQPVLRAAWNQHDHAAVTAILRTMAQAGQFNDDLLATATRLARGLASVTRAMPAQTMLGWRPNSAAPTDPRQGLDARTVHAAVAWFLARSLTMPNYGHLLQACKPDRAEFADRDADCAAIGMLLQRADIDGAARIGQYLVTATSIDADVSPPGAQPKVHCPVSWRPMPDPGRSFVDNITAAARDFHATVRAGSELGGMHLVCTAPAAGYRTMR